MNKQTFKVMLSASENQQNKKQTKKSIWLQRKYTGPGSLTSVLCILLVLS